MLTKVVGIRLLVLTVSYPWISLNQQFQPIPSILESQLHQNYRKVFRIVLDISW